MTIFKRRKITTDLYEFTLKSEFLEVKILNLGGIIKNIMAPDKNGAVGDIVLGYDDPKAYLQNPHYFGAIIGRVAGRVPDGRFTLDGKDYELVTNCGPHQLHGGPEGFSRRIFEAGIISKVGGPALRLSRRSYDGEEGYPGNLDVSVTYTLEGKRLILDYTAVTDKPTPVSLTNHSYFNLSCGGTVDNHILKLASQSHFEMGGDLLFTGRELPVLDTKFDFSLPKEMGSETYDDAFSVDTFSDKIPFAELFDKESGRLMRAYTDKRCVVLYNAAGLLCAGGKGDAVYGNRAALCLETQCAPGRLQILRPGETYRAHTVYEFDVKI